MSMGRVEEWNVMLEDFFDRMFFCAVIAFEEEEVRREVFGKNSRAYMKRDFEKNDCVYAEKEEISTMFDALYRMERANTMESIPWEEVYEAEFILNDNAVLWDGEESPVEKKMLQRLFEEENERAENFFGDVEFVKTIERYDGEEVKERQGIKLKRDRIEKILEGDGEVRGNQTGEVTIRMINNNNTAHEIDIDETMNLIGERLYELMGRSADGLYW